MAQRRHIMATAKRLQSGRRIRFCLPNNEPSGSKEICWKEILLEPEDLTNNQDEKKKKED